VLRAAAGAAAVHVTFSHWLLLLTLLGALFLGLSKRRAEIVALTDTADSHRQEPRRVQPYLLDQMISVVTASTLLAYAFYTISPDTEQRFGTAQLIWTVPFPLYGIFRYLYLVISVTAVETLPTRSSRIARAAVRGAMGRVRGPDPLRAVALTARSQGIQHV
jgi:hypothetical protein